MKKIIFLLGIVFLISLFSVSAIPAGENITVWLNSPADNLINTTGTNIIFDYNVSSESADIANCSLYLNESGTWGIHMTNTSAVTNNSANTFTTNLTHGDWLWNVECCALDDNCSFTSGGTVPANRTLSINLSVGGYSIGVALISPKENSAKNLLTNYFNFTYGGYLIRNYKDDFDNIDIEDFYVANPKGSEDITIDRDTNERIESVGDLTLNDMGYAGLNLTEKPVYDGIIDMNFTFNANLSTNGQELLVLVSESEGTGNISEWINTIGYRVVLDNHRIAFVTYNGSGAMSGKCDYTGTSLEGVQYARMYVNSTHAQFTYDNDVDRQSPTETFTCPASNLSIENFGHIGIIGNIGENDHILYGDDFSMYIHYFGDFENYGTADTCQLWTNETGSWALEETLSTGLTINTTLGIPHSFTADGEFIWNVGCDTTTNSSFTFAQNNYTITIDREDPAIIPEPDLGNNNTIIWNTSIDTYINFTDNREIYSVSVIWGNTTLYSNATNIGLTSYQVNISDIISQTETGLLNLTARVCDAHTLTSISDVDWSEKDNGLDFIMKKKWWLFRDEWVRIYPKTYSEYTTPTTYKQEDRYPFIFNKKDKPNEIETFIVESSDYIDIIGNKNYEGHLIIPAIGENGYWIDFENEESTKTEIKRISDTKVEVTIYGLKSKRIEFDSIGELNCDSETFYFNNLVPSVGYPSHVIVGDNLPFYLNVTESSVIITSLNASIVYNHTAYYVSAISNFTKSVIVPTSVDGNTSLIPFFWSINVDGTEYNLTSYNQNVSDFYLDDCTDYSTGALNFTIIDEETSDEVNADWTGRFNYSYNNIKKYYDLTVTAENTTQMCIFPNNITFTNSYYYIYYDESGYPQRKYIDTPVTIDNVTDNIVMYALASADGIYGRFQIVDSYSNPIEDASGIMKKEISGSWTTIESETSDGSGLMTFWLNPDTTYQFTFSKAGYGSVTETLRVTTTEIYTVTLGGTAEPRNISYSAGVSYGFYPNFDLQNDTKYNFSFVMDSDYWDITDCTLYLKNESTTISSSSTSYTTTNCNITIELDTDSYTTITSETIYNLNSSNNIIVSTQYTVAYRYVGEFSLKSFLDDLKAFGGAGFNDFTRMVIAFIIIFILLASVSYNMGVVDPEVTIGLLIMLTCLFSYIGWLTLPYDGIRTEWLKQYIIAILISLGGGAFIMKRATE